MRAHPCANQCVHQRTRQRADQRARERAHQRHQRAHQRTHQRTHQATHNDREQRSTQRSRAEIHSCSAPTQQSTDVQGATSNSEAPVRGAHRSALASVCPLDLWIYHTPMRRSRREVVKRLIKSHCLRRAPRSSSTMKSKCTAHRLRECIPYASSGIYMAAIARNVSCSYSAVQIQSSMGPNPCSRAARHGLCGAPAIATLNATCTHAPRATAAYACMRSIAAKLPCRPSRRLPQERVVT